MHTACPHVLRRRLPCSLRLLLLLLLGLLLLQLRQHLFHLLLVEPAGRGSARVLALKLCEHLLHLCLVDSAAVRLLLLLLLLSLPL